jgi:DNA-binding transcriptional regulator LsrR (DeoR family)
MATVDELRLMTKVAKMYYEWNLNQVEIGEKLSLSQASISRLFKRARIEGIIRISVNVPGGVNSDLEDVLVRKFSLRDAIVVDCISEDENQIMRDIGAAASFYIETTIKDHDIVGISSWSSSLLALLDSMHQVSGKTGIQVVQILGGVGNPSAEVHAIRLTGRFAGLVNGSAIFLPAPGIVGTEAALNVMLEDAYVQEAMQLFDKVNLALVGIGSVEPSKLLDLSGNVFSIKEQNYLRQHGAVGDILLRFYDKKGTAIHSAFNNRVMSMSLEQLRKVDRSVAVAGGARKYQAILGALRGKYINVLITDSETGKKLSVEN